VYREGIYHHGQHILETCDFEEGLVQRHEEAEDVSHDREEGHPGASGQQLLAHAACARPPEPAGPALD